MSKGPAVVIVSYRIPEVRLRDFFRWNDATFRRDNATVYAVTDREYDVPDYGRCVIYPEELLPKLDGEPKFSLAKTKNRGLKTAMLDGHHVVICSDVDIWFPPQTWDRLAAVPPGMAMVPIYMMAMSWERRHQDCHQDRGATGTIAMQAQHWQEIHYDPRYIGYGAEDGKIMQDIRGTGLEINRTMTVYHIAHERGAPQHNFQDRTDYHNPDFNPWRLEENAKFAGTPTPEDPDADA